MAGASSFDSSAIDSPVRAGEGSGLLHEVGPSWELRGVGVEDLYDASLAQVATEALHKDPADRGEADVMCVATWLAKQRHVLAKHLGDAGHRPSQDLLRYLARHVSLVNFHAGTLVFRQGEVGGAFYIVVRGSVQVYHKAWTHADDHVFEATSGHGVNVQEDGSAGAAVGAGIGAGAGAGASSSSAAAGVSPLGMLIGELAEGDTFGSYSSHSTTGVRRAASVVACGVGSGEPSTLPPTGVIKVPAACYQRHIMPELAAAHRERQRLVRMLRRLRMFEGWPDPELEFMASWMKPVTLGKHDVLYYAGSVPEQVYFLAQGTVMLTGTSKKGGRTIVEAVTAPGVVGSLELTVGEAVRMYEARPVGDRVVGARISADRFQKLVLSQMATDVYDTARHLREVCSVRQRFHEARLALLATPNGARDQRHTVLDLHAFLLLPIQARVIPCAVCGLAKGHVAFECDKLPRELSGGAGAAATPTRVPVLTVRMPEIVGRSPHGAPRWRVNSPRTPRNARGRGGSITSTGSRRGSASGVVRPRPPSPLGTPAAASRPGSAGGASAGSGGAFARASSPSQQAPLPRMSDRLVTLRFPGAEHPARSTSSGSDSGSTAGSAAGSGASESGRSSGQGRGKGGAAAVAGGARRGRTLFRARRVEDIQAEADGTRSSPRSQSPRRRSLDHVMLSARGSPKAAPGSPSAAGRRRSRRHSLVLSIIGARGRPRSSSGARNPVARLAGSSHDATHSPGGVDWNAPSPRPPSPTHLVLADAAFEMGVVARVALMLKRAVRAFKQRQPNRFRRHHRVCVRRPQVPEPCSSPDSDDVLSGFLAPRPRASFRRSSRPSLTLAAGSSKRLTRSVSGDSARAGRSAKRLGRSLSHGNEHLDTVAEGGGDRGSAAVGPSPSRGRRSRRASRHRRTKSGGAVVTGTRTTTAAARVRPATTSTRRLSWIRAGVVRQPGPAAMERHSLRVADGSRGGDVDGDPALVGGDGVGVPSRAGASLLSRRRGSSTANLQAGAAPGQTLKPSASASGIARRSSASARQVHPAGPDSIDVERARRLAVALESPSPTHEGSEQVARDSGRGVAAASRDTVVHRRSRLGTGLVTRAAGSAAGGASASGASHPLRTTSNAELPRSSRRAHAQPMPSLRARSLGSLAPATYDGSLPGFGSR